MNTRQCKTCGQVKLIEAFPKSASNYLGVKPHCKDCLNKRYQPVSGRFNDEAELDWRDDDLEVKNRRDYWLKQFGYDGTVAKARQL